MATITITRLHGLLASKLGNETAEHLTTYISENIKEQVKETSNEIATKDFVRSEIAEVKEYVAESKTEMIKWFVGGFITLVVMLAGIFATIIFRK